MKRAVLALAVLCSGFAHAAACTEGQLPYYGGGFGTAYTGLTAQSICTQAEAESPWNTYVMPLTAVSGQCLDANGSQLMSINLACDPPPDPPASAASGPITVTLVAPDIFNISPSGAAQISGAILLVWACAFGFRVVIRSLNVDGDSSSTSERD